MGALAVGVDLDGLGGIAGCERRVTLRDPYFRQAFERPQPHVGHMPPKSFEPVGLLAGQQRSRRDRASDEGPAAGAG